MSIDDNCGIIFNFGLLWQRSKCIENPVYQLFLYFLFWTYMYEIKCRPHFSFTWSMQNTTFKKLLTANVKWNNLNNCNEVVSS